MASAAEIFENEFRKFSVLVSNAERNLEKLKEKVPKLQKSLDASLITVANQIGLVVALNNAILVLFSGAARSSIPCFGVSFVMLMLIFFLVGVAMLLRYGHGRIKMIKSRIRGFLTDVRNLKFEVHGLPNRYENYREASGKIEGVTDELRAEVHDLEYKINRFAYFEEAFGSNDGVEILQAAGRMYVKIIWVIGFFSMVYTFVFLVAAFVLFCRRKKKNDHLIQFLLDFYFRNL